MPKGSTPEFRKAIGQRIRQQRLSHKFSLEKLAAETGLSAPFLCELESGKRQPAARTLLLLSQSLGVSIDWLVKGESQCPKS